MEQNKADITGKWAVGVIGGLIGFLLIAVIAHTALNVVYNAEKKAARQKVYDLFNPTLQEMREDNAELAKIPAELKSPERVDLELKLLDKELEIIDMKMKSAEEAEEIVRKKYEWARPLLQKY